MKAAKQFRRRASDLPEFLSEDAWPKWWTLAEEIFDRDGTFEHQWQDEQARQRLIASVPPSKQRRKGDVKSQLKTMLRGKFESMAGANKF